MKDFTKIAGLLHELQNRCLHELKTRKKLLPPFPKRWTSEHQSVFDTLKSLVTSTQVLGYADFTKPFVLETDASNQGLGAVVSQGNIHYVAPFVYQGRADFAAEECSSN